MQIPLSKLNYVFLKKPLLVGGMAMQYNNLRRSGEDIDLIATEEDVVNLIKMYPDRVKDLWGDLGVCPFEFEIWKTIHYRGYEDLSKDAVEEGEFLVISKEKLLLTKVLAMDKEKYFKDTQLIVKSLLNENADNFSKMITRNRLLLKDMQNISYLEKKGPEK